MIYPADKMTSQHHLLSHPFCRHGPITGVISLSLGHRTYVCQGVGCPDPWYNRGDPVKVGACKSFLFTESSLGVKIKNTCLIL